KAYSIFTLETHICYLDEVNLNEKVDVQVQLIDYDAKRLHVLLIMKDEEGNRVATSEQMLMGMDMETRSPAQFQEEIAAEVEKLATAQKDIETPKEVGRTIGIRRK